MDNQSFELLMSKLEGLEAGQTRIEESLTKRLDEHNIILQKHTDDDKAAWSKLDEVTLEVKIGKRIFYVLASAFTAVVGYLGWGKP